MNLSEADSHRFSLTIVIISMQSLFVVLIIQNKIITVDIALFLRAHIMIWLKRRIRLKCLPKSNNLVMFFYFYYVSVSTSVVKTTFSSLILEQMRSLKLILFFFNYSFRLFVKMNSRAFLGKH